MFFSFCLFGKKPFYQVWGFDLHFVMTSDVELEKAMAPHSSTLAWKIPWTEEPGGLQSMGSRRVGHDWATSLHFHFSCIGEGNGNPLQCSCLENPRDGGAWWAAVYVVAQSRTRLKQLSSSSSSDIEHLKFLVFFPLTLLWLIPGLGQLNLSHHWFLYILCVKHAFFFLHF